MINVRLWWGKVMEDEKEFFYASYYRDYDAMFLVMIGW